MNKEPRKYLKKNKRFKKKKKTAGKQWTETPNEASVKFVDHKNFDSAESIQVMLTCFFFFFEINVFCNKIIKLRFF